jgi:hypothetical protein
MQLTLIAAMKASSHPRTALIYAMKVPSYERVVK